MFEKKIKMLEADFIKFKDSYITEINNLKSENEKLKLEATRFKKMYDDLLEAKTIMRILKILDDNNSPDITKQKLSKLWDVLPYYPPDWTIRKWIVKRRDCYTCQKCGKNLYYCKEGYGHVHHIKPLSIGGTNEIKNLIYVCSECHKKIHDDMYNFHFAQDEREVLYEDWTYYRIFSKNPMQINKILSDKKELLSFDSYKEVKPDTDKYYNISYWEGKL